MPYTQSFSELNRDQIPAAGGKGANLGELAAAGFPVPAGFVLTTAAYEAFVQANALQDEIVTLAQTAADGRPESAEAAAAQIYVLFRQGTIPDDLAGEIAAAYRKLTASGRAAVAVRSSATAEDLPSASFAGQQETFLNIAGEDALLEAVKNCWASLWTARALAYRQRQGIDPAAVSLAVVVQRLVEAEAAGVLFTADPLTGERDHLLINAAWGLGEALVGGLVTPDAVVVDKATGAVLSRETAVKTTLTALTGSGTAEKEVPAAKQRAPVLDDETAAALARLGTRIEAHYGTPMDVEWALAGGEIAILQARPITALPPAPLKDVTWEPPVPDTIWMRRQIVEHMPEPLSPLFEDLYLQRGLDRTMEDLIARMGRAADVRFNMATLLPDGFARTINGYAYSTGSLNLDAENLKATLRVYARMGRLMRMREFDWEGTVLPTYQGIIARWDEIDLATTSDEALLAGMEEMAAADSAFWFGSAVNLGLSRVMDPLFDRLLKSFLFRAAVPRPGLGSSAFLRGFDSKALDAQAEMEEIAAEIRASDPLRALVEETPAAHLLTRLAGHPEGPPLLAHIEQYLAAYGHQIYNLDFAAPTQTEDPLPMLLSLKALVKNPPAVAVRTRQEQMAA